jgi:hypothetical protein
MESLRFKVLNSESGIAHPSSGEPEFIPTSFLSENRVVYVVSMICLDVLSFELWCSLRLSRKQMFVLTSICFVGCLGYICYLYLFTYTDFQQICCSCCFTVTERVSIVEQELLTLPEHLLSLPFFMRFLMFIL